MGRSVSTHLYAVKSVFLSLTFGEQPEEGHEAEGADYCDFDDFLLDLRQVLDGSAGAPGGKGFPTLRECDRWQGREDHVILENERGEVSVSEYCGIVSVCLAPRNSDNPLDQHWCWQAAENFEKLLHGAFSKSALVSHGPMSNGVGVYSRPGKSLTESCITGNEGALWGEEGALLG